MKEILQELLNTKTLPLAPEGADMQISRCWESSLRKSHFALLLFPKHVFIVGPCQEDVNVLGGSLYGWYNSMCLVHTAVLFKEQIKQCPVVDILFTS